MYTLLFTYLYQRVLKKNWYYLYTRIICCRTFKTSSIFYIVCVKRRDVFMSYIKIRKRGIHIKCLCVCVSLCVYLCKW